MVTGTAEALAQGCVNMRHITEPQLVVLAGGMIKSADLLVAKIRGAYQAMMWSLKPEPMDISPAELGDDAGVVGAAGVAVHAKKNSRIGPIGT